MTPERLNFIIENCFRNRRKASLTTHYQDIAAFFHVEPVTLRRWLAGKQSVPRTVEIVMEIFHAWPQITARSVNEIIDERDARNDNDLGSQKRHRVLKSGGNAAE